MSPERKAILHTVADQLAAQERALQCTQWIASVADVWCEKCRAWHRPKKPWGRFP